MTDRYLNWSPRILIDIVLLNIVRYPLLWRVLDAACFFVVPISLIYLISPEKFSPHNSPVTFFIILLYPLYHLSDSGWMATTTNYLFPLTCDLLALVLVQYLSRQRYSSFPQKFVLVLSLALLLLFGCNQEQSAVWMFLILSMNFAFFSTKKVNFYLLTSSVVALFSTIFLYFSPSNAVRKQSNIDYWMPEFVDHSLFDNIYLGFLLVYRSFFTSYSYILLVFALVLAFAVWERQELSDFCKYLSSVPVLLMLWLAFSPTLSNFYPNLNDAIFFPAALHDVDGSQSSLYYPLAVFILFFGITLFLLYQLFKLKPLSFVKLACILFAGYIASAILGFSPTVWGSGLRTQIFLYFSFAFILLAVYRQMKQHTLVNKVLFVFTVYAVINNFCLILSYREI